MPNISLYQSLSHCLVFWWHLGECCRCCWFPLPLFVCASMHVHTTGYPQWRFECASLLFLLCIFYAMFYLLAKMAQSYVRSRDVSLVAFGHSLLSRFLYCLVVVVKRFLLGAQYPPRLQCGFATTSDCISCAFRILSCQHRQVDVFIEVSYGDLLWGSACQLHGRVWLHKRKDKPFFLQTLGRLAGDRLRGGKLTRVPDRAAPKITPSNERRRQRQTCSSFVCPGE